MRFNLLKIKPTRSFNQRKNYVNTNFNHNNKVNTNFIQLYFEKSGTFQSCYFFFFKILCKKLLHVKNIRFIKRKLWVYLCFNYPISKKSKNSRMGKGAGAFFRWGMRCYKNNILLRTLYINKSVLFKFTKIFKLMTQLPIKFYYYDY